MKIHLDTDLGCDPDDAAALALLLGRPEVDLVAITTCLDHGGRRAGCAAHILELAHRPDVPVVAGAAATLAGARHDPLVEDRRHWPTPVTPRPAPLGAAVSRLERSIEEGATIATIGPVTNLAVLERRSPGRLDGVPVVLMGGWVEGPTEGYPPWGPERDWNLQCDPEAAEVVLRSGADLTLVTIPATVGVSVRRAQLPRLRAAGPLGTLLADQLAAWGADHNLEVLGRVHDLLPDDLTAFHWDPVTCAVALGWPGATTASAAVRAVRVDGGLRWSRDPGGRAVRHVTDIDAAAFDEMWVAAVEVASRRPLSTG